MDREIVLVTGGARGIGEAIVKRVASHRRIVIFTYNKSEEKAGLVSGDLNDMGYENYYYELDVSSPENVEKVVQEIGDRFKDIHVLINNAGIARDNPLYLLSDEEWNDVISTNLSGVFYMSRAVSRYMTRNRSGKIINISSVTAATGARGQSNYSAAKGGIESLTRTMAIELSPKNIIVNGVAPGVIESDMSEELMKYHGDEVLARILMNRTGKPAEVAAVVNFLISEDASYINGQVINVDGGMMWQI